MFFQVFKDTPLRAVAQGFSVHVWGTWGRRFKSAQPDLEKAILRGWPFHGITTLLKSSYTPAARILLFSPKQSYHHDYPHSSKTANRVTVDLPEKFYSTH